MLKNVIILLFLTSSVVFGVSIIDSGRRNYMVKTDDNNEIDVIQDDCPNLTPKLIGEIKSHQSVVNDIVNAIVKGKYSGDTWNA